MVFFDTMSLVIIYQIFFTKKNCFRCHEALQACLAFNSRVPHDLQAAKMADLWPVENLWGLLQQRVKRREPMTKEELRRYIEEEWCKIDDDKALCRRFMQSIPKRLQVSHEFYVILACDWSSSINHGVRVYFWQLLHSRLSLPSGEDRFVGQTTRTLSLHKFTKDWTFFKKINEFFYVFMMYQILFFIHSIKVWTSFPELVLT